MTRRAAVAAGASLATVGLATVGAAEQREQETRRGSEKLIERLAGMKGGVSQTQIRELLRVLTRSDCRLVDWYIRGIPVPEVVFGTVLAPVNVAGALASQIYEAKLRANFRLFPNGIPPLIDQVRVEIELGA
jgi:hypothetical protein